ncbi:MAG: hypothetical protein ACPGWR_32855, partial [Ardenticatenaceae bacterium]
MRFFRRRVRGRIKAPDPEYVRTVLDFGASGARAVVVRLSADGADVLGAVEMKGYSGIARPGQVMYREQIAN